MTAAASRPASALTALIAVEPGEATDLALSFAMFFCVLASYLAIRPVREAMGAGLEKGALANLFTVVFLVMLALVPVYGTLATRLPRCLLLPLVYGFFITNLVLFAILMREGVTAWLASVFFVWVSVYNLFVVSLFWSTMAQRWSNDAAKRLFGVISAGGTLGALAGPALAQGLVGRIGVANIALVSAAFLALALFANLVLNARPTAIPLSGEPDRAPLSFSAIVSGATRVATQPYLFRIALFILLANLVSTLFYLEQSRLVHETITDPRVQVAYFASRDLMVSVATALIQFLGTARLLARLGLTAALAALPVVCIVGLVSIGVMPTLAAVSAVMVVERITAFALSGPAMRVLYTVVDPDDKFKAQNFIDTVVYRAGDAASGWLFAFTGKTLALGALATAIGTVPFAAVWLGSSLALGRMHRALAARKDA